MEQLSFAEINPCLTLTVFEFKTPPSELAQRLGIEFSIEHDRLGARESAFFRDPRGLPYGLFRYLSKPNTNTCAVVHEDTPDISGAIERILVDLGIYSEEILGHHPDLKFNSCSVFRSDDHGNVVKIEDVCCRSDAMLRVKHFEDLGHKQTYWFAAKEKIS